MTPSPQLLQTVLLVDDNAEIRGLVQQTLEESGLEVLVAADAASALQIEGQFPRAIHLLLSDVMMPGLSGPDLAKRLEPVRPEMRVMLMSGEGMPLLNYRWYFLQKPFRTEVLMDRVNDILHCEARGQVTDAIQQQVVS